MRANQVISYNWKKRCADLLVTEIPDYPEESMESVNSMDNEMNDEEMVTKSINRQNRKTIRKMSTVIGVELGDLK